MPGGSSGCLRLRIEEAGKEKMLMVASSMDRILKCPATTKIISSRIWRVGWITLEPSTMIVIRYLQLLVLPVAQPVGMLLVAAAAAVVVSVVNVAQKALPRKMEEEKVMRMDARIIGRLGQIPFPYPRTRGLKMRVRSRCLRSKPS